MRRKHDDGSRTEKGNEQNSTQKSRRPPRTLNFHASRSSSTVRKFYFTQLIAPVIFRVGRICSDKHLPSSERWDKDFGGWRWAFLLTIFSLWASFILSRIFSHDTLFPTLFLFLSLSSFFGTLSAARNVLRRKETEWILAGRKRERPIFTLWERAGRLSPIKNLHKASTERVWDVNSGGKREKGKKMCARRFSPSQQRRERKQSARSRRKKVSQVSDVSVEKAAEGRTVVSERAPRVRRLNIQIKKIEISPAKKLVAGYLECEVETKKKRKRGKKVWSEKYRCR